MSPRRRFLETAGLAALALPAAARAGTPPAAATAPLRPARLKRGDTVGLIAPANAFHLRHALLPPHGESLPEAEIYSRLLERMGAMERILLAASMVQPGHDIDGVEKAGGLAFAVRLPRVRDTGGGRYAKTVKPLINLLLGGDADA